MNFDEWKKTPPDEARAIMHENILGRLDTLMDHLGDLHDKLDDDEYLDAADECFFAHLAINEIGSLLIMAAHRFQPEKMAEREKVVAAHAFRHVMGVEPPSEN